MNIEQNIWDPKKMRLNVEILRKAIISYRKEGFRKCLAKMIYRTIFRVVTIRIVYKLDLNQIKFVPGNKGFTIEEMNLYDLDLMYSIYGHEIPQRRYEYLKGIIKSYTSSCYMIKNNTGDIGGYCCLGFGKESHAKIFSKVKDMDIHKNGYLFRDYTFKKFRGQGLHKFGIYSRLLILKNKGYKTATTRIAKGNITSEHSYGKFDFRKSLIEIHFHLFNRFLNSKFLVIPLCNLKVRGLLCR